MHIIAVGMDDFLCFGCFVSQAKTNSRQAVRRRSEKNELNVCKMRLDSNFAHTHRHLCSVLCSRNTCNLIHFYVCVCFGIYGIVLSYSTIIFRHSFLCSIYITCKLLFVIDELHKLARTSTNILLSSSLLLWAASP